MMTLLVPSIVLLVLMVVAYWASLYWAKRFQEPFDLSDEYTQMYVAKFLFIVNFSVWLYVIIAPSINDTDYNWYAVYISSAFLLSLFFVISQLSVFLSRKKEQKKD